MRDKIALIMEEAGCERAEAELALEACGYDVSEALQAIATRLRRLTVLKAKFGFPANLQYGLLLVVIDLKTGLVARLRTVLSYNPSVYGAPLEGDWFEFEKRIYGFRLREGSLQSESLEFENFLAGHWREAVPETLRQLSERRAPQIALELGGLLEAFFKGPVSMLKLKKETIDLGQFKSLRAAGQGLGGRVPSGGRARGSEEDEPLILSVSIEHDEDGVLARDLRVGDWVRVRISDERDIATYLAKVFGGVSDSGDSAIPVPVEAVETAAQNASSHPGKVLVRVRFSIGACGDAIEAVDARVRVTRSGSVPAQKASWWRRLIGK